MSVALSISTKFKAIDSMSAVMTKMSKSASMFGKRATATFDRVSRAGKKLNKTFSGLGGQVAGLAGGFAVASAVQSGAAAFVDFDQSIQSAGAKFALFNKPAAEAEMKMNQLRDAAKEAGATTKFTGAEAAQGLNFLALAGFSVDEAIGNLPTILNLAAAAEIDLARASDIATDTLGAMGSGFDPIMTKAEKLTTISDIMAKTVTTSNTTMELMFETVNEAGSVFTNAGGSMAEFAAITGTMANSGIKGSKAGTAIKNMMVNLQAPSAKMATALSSMGVNIDDGTGKMKKMSTIVGEMITGTNDWTDIQRNAAFATIFGKNSLAGATITMNAGAKSIDEYTASLEDSKGTSKKMADFMSKGLGGVIASLSSAFESIAIAIGETFKGEIDATIKSLTEIARTSKAWIVDNRDLIKTVFNAAVVIVKFLIAIKLITVAFGAYQMIVKAAGIAQAAFNVIAAMNPIGLIVIAIVAAIAVIAIIIAKWDEWGAAMTIFLGPLGMVISMIQSFRANWDMIKDSFSNGGILGGIKSIGKVLLDSLLYPLQQLFELMSNLPGVGDTFKGFATGIKEFRTDMGVHIADKSEDPANPEAATNKATVLREESTKNQKIAIDINDKSGMASIAENTGVPIQLSQTLGF